jgi:hypothetical protein
MRNASILLLSTLVFCTAADAQPGEGRGRRDREDSVSVDVSVSFGRDAEIEILTYFRDHPYEPVGLPPGVARNLARGKPLPPGIAKRYPPRELLRRLPDYPGCEVVIVDDDVLLVAAATGIILDVVSGAF